MSDKTNVTKLIEKELAVKCNDTAFKALLQHIQEVGNPYIFGGFVRDFHFDSDIKTSSDIDIVVFNVSDRLLIKDIPGCNIHTNSFGGYKIDTPSITVDVWKAEDTWAYKENLVKFNEVESLLETTFFNWDSTAYSLKHSNIIYGSNYLYNIEKRYLDIKLEENLFPISMVVRTLRFYINRGANLSDKLFNYVKNTLNNVTPESVLSYEEQFFKSPVISQQTIKKFISA